MPNPELTTEPSSEITFTGARSTKQTWRVYGDGRERSDIGQFGRNNPRVGSGVEEPSISYQFPLIGLWQSVRDFFSADFNFGLFSSSVSLGLHTGKYLPIEINEDLDTFSRRLIRADMVEYIKSALLSINCDLKRVVVKRTYIEGPAVSAGANYSLRELNAGGHATAQLTAACLDLDTTMGQVTLKVKVGVGAGLKSAPKVSHTGKAYSERSQSVSQGIIELSFAPGTRPPPATAASSGAVGSPRPTPIPAPGSTPIPTPAARATPTAATNASSRIQPPPRSTTSSAASPSAAEPATASTRRSAARAATAVQPTAVARTTALSTEQIYYMDRTVTSIAEQCPSHGAVQRICEEYRGATDKTTAFIKFNRDLRQIEAGERRFSEVTSAVNNTAFFLSQAGQLTGNRDIGKFATGLGASMQVISGMRNMSNAITLMGTSGAAGGLSLASMGGLLGGAGLVLGGISLVASLCGGDDDNGLGEALAQIHSAIMGMWSEMRTGFQQTWQILDQMEQNNVQRYKYTLIAIEQTRRDVLIAIQVSQQNILWRLATFQQNVTSQLDLIHADLRSYLDHLSDQKLNKSLEALRIGTAEQIRAKLTSYIVHLFNWLTQTATIAARTGYYPTVHARASLQAPARIKELNQFIAPERPTFNLKLGLLVSLVEEIVPNLLTRPNLVIINPNSWYQVLTIYLDLVNIAKHEPQFNASEFGRQLNQLINIVDSTIYILQRITDSTEVQTGLWSQLINRYQRSFDNVYPMLNAVQSTRDNIAAASNDLQRQRAEFINNLQLHYLELVAFIHLIDVNYHPTEMPIASETLDHHLSLLVANPALESSRAVISAILPRITADLWKEPLRGHLHVDDATFTALDLKNHLARSLPQNPIWQTMQAAKQLLEPLAQELLSPDFNLRQMRQQFADQHSALTNMTNELRDSLNLLALFSDTEAERYQHQVLETAFTNLLLRDS